jgi:hypothetical protein
VRVFVFIPFFVDCVIAFSSLHGYFRLLVSHFCSFGRARGRIVACVFPSFEATIIMLCAVIITGWLLFIVWDRHNVLGKGACGNPSGARMEIDEIG